ncbi:MAG: Lipopolysaccharide export system permease protein LptF [Syntrophus sp. PtaU1.Bin208]|nr:MAG: Lipopolysaccharide export system permease protein LptF [Syntrophus sp. PtaU1.Bin208]
MKIIDRYLIKEVLQPFGIVLFIMTFVLLMGKILQLMDLMINKGVSLITIGQIILFLLPSFLVFTIPIALLISILIALGRLSSDNELTVLKASGLSLYRITPPILLIAAAAFLLTVFTTLFLAPYSNAATKSLLFKIARTKASIGIKEKVFYADFKGILLYANKIPSDGSFLEGVLVSDQRTDDDPATILARKAFLISDPKSMDITLRLENGSTYSVTKDMKNFRKMDFKYYDINLDISSSLNEALRKRTKSAKEMNLEELLEKITNSNPNDTVYREYVLELNRKFSLPFSCLIFGILGIPLGVKAHHRSVKARGFTLGFLTVLLYYLLQLGCDALVTSGKLLPFLGSWIPTFLFTVTAIYLYFAAAAERPVDLTSPLNFLQKWHHKSLKRNEKRP